MKHFSFCLWILFVFTPLHAQRSSNIDTLGLSSVPPYRDKYPSQSASDTLFYARTLWTPFDGPTMGVQAATGLGLAAAIFLPASSRNSDGLGEALDILFRSILAGGLLPLGIYETGSLMGGNGSYISTGIGTLAGAGIALLPNLIQESGKYSESGIRAAILGIAGGIIGYQYSASPIYDLNEKQLPELPSSSNPEKALRVQSPKTSIEVFLLDGGITSGYLSGIDQQDITVLTKDGDVQIPNSEIKNIIVRGKHATGKRVAYGAFIGAYLGMYTVNTYKPDPFYLDQHTGESIGRTLSSILPFMLGGAAAGLLVDGMISQDKVIDYSGGKALRTKSLKRLRYLAEESSTASKIHITVQGGQVFTNVQDYGSRGYGTPIRDASNFNWMRRWEISYSATNEIEVGVSKIWFGEPSLHDSRYEASGYYLMGHYTPSLGVKLDSVINLSLGLGVGNADVSYQRHGFSFYPDGSYYFASQSVGFSETMLTGVIMGEARFHIDDGLTLGITVDHVIAPTRNVPGDPSIGIESRSFNLGNTCLGFSLGVYF